MSLLFVVGPINGFGENSEMNTEIGWYILGEAQQHIGPYALSELRGESSIYLVIVDTNLMLFFSQSIYIRLD